MSHQLLHFFLLFPLIHLLFIKSTGSADYGKNSTDCPSYNCGGVTIAYPFWHHDENTASQHCGYPGFGVNCTTVGNIPTITLPEVTYHIRNISYDSRSLTLIDDHVANQICPRVHNNITLGDLSMTFSKLDLNLTFLFNCTTDLAFGAIVIPCFDSSAKRTYVATGDEYEDSSWYEHCDEKVVTTVIKNEINLNRNDKDLGVIIGEGFDKGFLLDWMPDNECLECERKDGRCGYEFNRNRSGPNKFLCFCSDGTSENDHYCKGKCH